MRSPERQSSRPALPGGQAAASWLARIRRITAGAPLPVKIAVVAAAIICAAPLLPVILLVALVYAPLALYTGNRSVLSTVSVALWGIAAVGAAAHGPAEPRYLLLLLAAAVATASHAGPLGRWRVPCRTVAWVLLWSLPVGITVLRVWPGHSLLGPVMAYPIALVVLGWRAAMALQESRDLRHQAGGTGGTGTTLIAPVSAFAAGQAGAWAAGAPHAGPGAAAGEPGPAAGELRPAAGLAGPGTGQAAHAGDAGTLRGPDSGQRTARRAATGAVGRAAESAPVTIEEAIGELTAMIGLAAVKEQVRSVTASVEAARRRAIAGHSASKPMQHFVFLGPPGTGKTAVARVIGKIFYAFGLLDSPEVVEAQRANLVGEYLGATAIKTNELIDSALGRVLFIDEAYSLVNDSDGQGDRFGSEAVQALVKRAEDDRERLIIILAGYERQMESFLASNPGINSRFGIRIKFPGYSPAELEQLAEKAVQDNRELLDPGARPVLRDIFGEIGRRRLADELGNGRFVRTLLARAGQQRDVRVMAGAAEPTPAELVTIRGEDVERAYAELTTRYRGYTDTPTVEGALAELDALVGLELLKRQVHEIVAQLQVARLRERQGLASQPPARHFVFAGPPGTGKTTVARILGRVFAALGLLVRPEVIEAHRADLVGEHLGATAIKTSKLIDSALGGVLFIDEAYALHNEAYSGGDAFGSEAVATLLKRAEDDRDRLVVVLAGYTEDMDRLLRSNPGLASRFSTRIAFPSYSAPELSAIARSIAAQLGDRFDAGALPVLDSIFARVVEQGRIDALGNGRFARSLFERACATRDVRVSLRGDEATAADLTTVLADDLLTAYRELAG
jgi:SpoVK/Ycf46/Vps4 family AAA+-type ATPase